MARTHTVVDCSTGEVTEVPFTPEEEAERDAEEQAFATEQQKPRPPTLTEQVEALIEGGAKLASLKVRLGKG